MAKQNPKTKRGCTLVGVPIENKKHSALKKMAKRNKRSMGAELALIADPILEAELKAAK
jgi:hypothetical protein